MPETLKIKVRNGNLEKQRFFEIGNPSLDTHHGKYDGVHPSLDTQVRIPAAGNPDLDVHHRIYHGVYPSLEWEFRFFSIFRNNHLQNHQFKNKIN